MIRHRSDQHIDEAIAYAADHKPCVISCRTIAAMERATAYFRERDQEVRMIRVSTPRSAAIESLNLFEGGLIDVLVISSDLLYVTRDRMFRRAGCHLASADALLPHRITMFQLLLGRAPEAVDRVFVRRRAKGVV